MKNDDLKPCGLCGQGVCNNRVPMFYRLSIQTQVVDVGALRELAGLSMMLGSECLARVMGPDREIAREVGAPDDILICQTCAVEFRVLEIREIFRNRKSNEEPSNSDNENPATRS